MYDGFTIGRHQDIYNPWSICNYMRQRELIGYWVNTSSNKLVGDIIRRHPVESKYEIERLMAGEKVHKRINEGITFQYLEGDENSLWLLLLAVGYIKAENIVRSVEGIECDVSVTNRENGRGRYDIAMYPLQENTDAFIMEFKVQDRKKETDLEQTAKNALQQIEDKNYAADLLAAGIPAERIYKLGFAFEGKDVLVVSDRES